MKTELNLAEVESALEFATLVKDAFSDLSNATEESCTTAIELLGTACYVFLMNKEVVERGEEYRNSLN